jgi:hypothetical protein
MNIVHVSKPHTRSDAEHAKSMHLHAVTASLYVLIRRADASRVEIITPRPLSVKCLPPERPGRALHRCSASGRSRTSTTSCRRCATAREAPLTRFSPCIHVALMARLRCTPSSLPQPRHHVQDPSCRMHTLRIHRHDPPRSPFDCRLHLPASACISPVACRCRHRRPHGYVEYRALAEKAKVGVSTRP